MCFFSSENGSLRLDICIDIGRGLFFADREDVARSVGTYDDDEGRNPGLEVLR